MPNLVEIADFQVTAGTPFSSWISWIYTLQSRDFDTQKAFDTSGANDQLINLIYNGVKSPFEKIIYRLDILFKPNPIIINLRWYDCVISSRGSIIFTRRNRVKVGDNFWQCLVYIHVICINITIKQCISCIYKGFRGLYPTAWLTLQNTGSIKGSQALKAYIFGEEGCSGSDSKVCF